MIQSHDSKKDNNEDINIKTPHTLRAITPKVRLNSLNISEMNELNPTALVNINVAALPIDEQVHHFGKPKTKVKKAKV